MLIKINLLALAAELPSMVWGWGDHKNLRSIWSRLPILSIEILLDIAGFSIYIHIPVFLVVHSGIKGTSMESNCLA